MPMRMGMGMGMGSIPASQAASTGGTAPDAPVLDAVSGITQLGFTINWTKSTGATGYDVQITLLSDTTWASCIVDTSVGDVALYATDVLFNTDQNTHKYRVRATNSEGDSNWSTDDNSTAGYKVTHITGGTIATAGDYRYHTFTSSAKLTVTNGSLIETDYILVAGGGGGGSGSSDGFGGGGGGAGGLIIDNDQTLAAAQYSAVIGLGGDGATYREETPGADGSKGNNSTFNSKAAIAGGYGLGGKKTNTPEGTWGSGGGACGVSTGTRNGCAGTAGQGNNGGSNTHASYAGCGGGGYAGRGEGSTASGDQNGTAGGAGVDITMAPLSWGIAGAFAGGGGGGACDVAGKKGGTATAGGGMGGGKDTAGNNAIANTGGGGGGGAGKKDGGNGGSGILVVRYPTAA